MAATTQDIRSWFVAGKKMAATHMLVVCDTFDYYDYPVYVFAGAHAQGGHAGRMGTPQEAYSEFHEKNMQRIMEVYSLAMDMEAQLSEYRAFHFD